MCSYRKLSTNPLLFIFSVSSGVLRRSTARLSTYCYGYHLDKYNPILAAHPSLGAFPADSLLSFLPTISFFSSFSASSQPFSQLLSQPFMTGLHLFYHFSVTTKNVHSNSLPAHRKPPACSNFSQRPLSIVLFEKRSSRS